MNRYKSLFLFFLMLVSLGVISCGVLARLGDKSIWDDSYMFVRYADNFISSGKLSWNPGGEPAYGLTSVLFIILVIPIRFFMQDNASLAALLPSLLNGVLFLILLIILLAKYIQARPIIKGFAILVVLYSIAMSVVSVSTHFTSGMDTTFALAYLTLYVLVLKWHVQNASYKTIILLGLIGGVIYSVRPDLLLYTVIIPLSMAFFEPGKGIRKSSFIVLGITVSATLLQLLFYQLYFSSALPLSFYAKSFSHYASILQNFVNRYPGNNFLHILARINIYLSPLRSTS